MPEEWGEWMRERLLLDVPHRQVIFTILKTLWIFINLFFLEREGYLEFIARVTSRIPDKGQVMVRYYGLYANAHRGEGQEGEFEFVGAPDCR